MDYYRISAHRRNKRENLLTPPVVTGADVVGTSLTVVAVGVVNEVVVTVPAVCTVAFVAVVVGRSLIVVSVSVVNVVGVVLNSVRHWHS